jgi:fatty-acyl-CoA synthase
VTLESKPTDVAGCQLRPANFSTLTEALDYAALSRAGFNFYSPRGELLCVLPYRDLRDQATSLARRMLRAGLRAGERVAIIAETGPDFMRAFFASQYAALVPVPLPTPGAFAGRANYINHIHPMLASAKPKAVLAPEVFLDLARQAAAGAEVDLVGAFGELEGTPEDDQDLPPVRQDDLCYLQFSSGSTRSPTGVAVTHRALLANARGIVRDGLKVTPGDRCTSWLPFYHDMGLVGFVLAPLSSQLSTDYVAPDGFARMRSAAAASAKKPSWRAMEWLKPRSASALRRWIAGSKSIAWIWVACGEKAVPPRQTATACANLSCAGYR